MRQAKNHLVINPPGQGLHEITDQVRTWVAGQAIEEGLLTLYLHHTSASLVIQENADPDVMRDLHDFFLKLVPEDPSLYRHGQEGPDDMPAHVKAALTQTHLSVPVTAGHLDLGRWQGIYLFEHRHGAASAASPCISSVRNRSLGASRAPEAQSWSSTRSATARNLALLAPIRDLSSPAASIPRVASDASDYCYP